MVSFYNCFGDYDGVVIYEAPDETTAAATILAAVSPGPIQAIKTTTLAKEVVAVEEEIGRAPAQVALSWVRKQPGVVIPIVATRNVEQLKQNLGCLEVELGPEHLRRLDEVSKMDPGYPHDFWSGAVRDAMYGDIYDAIQDRRIRVSTL